MYVLIVPPMEHATCSVTMKCHELGYSKMMIKTWRRHIGGKGSKGLNDENWQHTGGYPGPPRFVVLKQVRLLAMTQLCTIIELPLDYCILTW